MLHKLYAHRREKVSSWRGGKCEVRSAVPNDPKSGILPTDLRNYLRSCLLASVQWIPIEWGIGDTCGAKLALTGIMNDVKIREVHFEGPL